MRVRVRVRVSTTYSTLPLTSFSRYEVPLGQRNVRGSTVLNTCAGRHNENAGGRGEVTETLDTFQPTRSALDHMHT